MTQHNRHTSRWASYAAALALASVAPVVAAAQQDSAVRLDSVARQDTVGRRRFTFRLPPVVTVTRAVGRSPLDLPYAISTMRPDSMRPGQRHTALDETLLLLPGVTVANRDNPAQDPRISIRGFGARSAFGVRSIRILRDGMPLTLPDGQTPVDYLDLESVGQVEVIRGSASALYGNGAGGVIDLKTAPPPVDPLAVQGRGWGGSDDFQRWVGLFGGSFTSGGYQGNYGYTATNGYRQYSHLRTTDGYGKVQLRVGVTDLAVQAMGLNTPTAEDPGQLTRAQFDSVPQMANPLSILKRARKAVSQGQVGVSAHRPLGDGDVTAQVYGGGRSLYNPLTFAVVDVKRRSYGAGLRADVPVRLFSVPNRFSVGADYQNLDDLRKNWANCNGVLTPTAMCPAVVPASEKGVLQLDQNEIVSSIGPYLRDEIEFAGHDNLSLGVRYDNVRFQVKDHLPITPQTPDGSGNRAMEAVSPIGGLLVHLAPLHSVYATVSSAFETPTTTELGNRANGSPGLNPNLKPQYSTTYETGVKGVLASGVQYDVSVFDTEVRDELIPFEVPGGNGRTYYRNAGRTRRYGAEGEIRTTIGPVDLGASYSYSHFRFTNFEPATDSNYAGHSIPGIPTHQVQASATYRSHGAFATMEEVVKGSVFVNDLNSARAAGYATTNLRIGGTAAFGHPWLSPVIGVENLFDQHYAGSIAVNAQLGRYYEPAPLRLWFAGLTLVSGR